MLGMVSIGLHMSPRSVLKTVLRQLKEFTKATQDARHSGESPRVGGVTQVQAFCAPITGFLKEEPVGAVVIFY